MRHGVGPFQGVAAPLALLPDQGCVSSSSTPGFLPGVAWSHHLVQAPRSFRFEVPASFEGRRQPIKAHSGCGVSRRDSLVGFSSLFLGSQRVEPNIPSAPTSDVFRRDVVAACANLGLGLVLGASRYAAIRVVRPDEGASSREEVNGATAKAGASARTAEMVTNTVEPNLVEASAYLWMSLYGPLMLNGTARRWNVQRSCKVDTALLVECASGHCGGKTRLNKLDRNQLFVV